MSAANRDANIGHKQDDESGLVYMRARYYEPTSGRFVSEDPSMDGINWFIYCNNDPIQLTDEAGESPDYQSIFNALLVASLLAALVANSNIAHTAGVVAVAGMVMLSLWFFDKYFDGDPNHRYFMGGGMWLVTHELFAESNMLLKEACLSPAHASSIEAKTVATFENYAIIITLFMVLEFNVG